MARAPKGEINQPEAAEEAADNTALIPATSDEGGETSVIEENAGKHEEELKSAIERMCELTDYFSFDFDTIVADLRDHMVELFKHRPKPWSQLVNSEQRDVAAGIEQVARHCIAQIVNAIASEGRPSLRAKLEGFTNKAGDYKASLKFMGNPTDEQLLSLNHASGKMVVLVTADVGEYDKAKHPRDISEDQGDIFESGDIEFPADNSDLAGESTELVVDENTSETEEEVAAVED